MVRGVDGSRPATLRARLSRLLDGLVYPPTLAIGGEPLRRSRVAALYLVIGSIVTLVPMTDHLLAAEWSLVGKLLIFWIACPSLLVATRLGLPATRAGLVFGLAGLVSLALSAFEFGTANSPPVIGMMFLPLAMVFISGVRAGALAGALTLALYASLAVSLADQPDGWQAQLLGLAALTVFVTLAALSFEHQRLRSIELLQAARDEAEVARDEAAAARDEAERARQRAERANAAKSDFLANMSHNDYKRETA